MSLAGELRERLRAPAGAPLLAGDDPRAASEARVPAAVLIAVTQREEPGLILTVRRDDLRTHAGQIAFPGGRIDAGEEPIEAALREADEELGLPPASVEVVTVLEPYATITGYQVMPVLGVVPPDLPLAPHEREVADWFEAPLGHVLDPAHHERKSVLFEGQLRYYYEIAWEGRRIWGATAAMLINLARRLS